MSPTNLQPARRADAGELVQANLDSRDHHAPWVQLFTTLDGFQDWLGAQATARNRNAAIPFCCCKTD